MGATLIVYEIQMQFYHCRNDDSRRYDCATANLLEFRIAAISLVDRGMPRNTCNICCRTANNIC